MTSMLFFIYYFFRLGMNQKRPQSFVFPPSNPASTTYLGNQAAPPFSPYLLPSQTPWAGAAAVNNVLPPNHPYLQVFIYFFIYFS